MPAPCDARLPSVAPERGVLVQDAPLDLLQLRAGLEAQFVVEHRPGLAVGLERLGLMPTTVQREHELAPRPLPERVILDQAVDLGHEALALAEREPGIDPIGRRGPALALEPPDRLLGELVVAEVCERRPSPEVEGARELPIGGRRIAGVERDPALGCEPFEPVAVELVGPDLEAVAARRGHEPVSADRPAQPRHILLDVLGGAFRRPVDPQVPDESVGRDGGIRLQKQDREEGAFLAAADRDRLAPVDDLDQAQQAIPHG